MTDATPAFAPRDPDYDARTRASFDRQGAMKILGIRVSDVAPGVMELEMPFTESFTQQHGFMHAGAITTALDSACGYAAFTLMAPGFEVLSVEFKTNFLAPAKGERFRIRAEVVKSGRTLSVADARAFSRAPDGETLIATMTATLMAVAT